MHVVRARRVHRRNIGIAAQGSRRAEALDWAALRHLAADPLLTLGSHSWHHHDMRMLDGNAARSELRRSREHLEDRTGAPVEHFCYPQAKWSHAVENEVGPTTAPQSSPADGEISPAASIRCVSGGFRSAGTCPWVSRRP